MSTSKISISAFEAMVRGAELTAADPILAHVAAAADSALAAAGISARMAEGAETTVTLTAAGGEKMDVTICRRGGEWSFDAAAAAIDGVAPERGDIIFFRGGHSIDIGNLSIAAAA